MGNKTHRVEWIFVLLRHFSQFLTVALNVSTPPLRDESIEAGLCDQPFFFFMFQLGMHTDVCVMWTSLCLIFKTCMILCHIMLEQTHFWLSTECLKYEFAKLLVFIFQVHNILVFMHISVRKMLLFWMEIDACWYGRIMEL